MALAAQLRRVCFLLFASLLLVTPLLAQVPADPQETAIIQKADELFKRQEYQERLMMTSRGMTPPQVEMAIAAEKQKAWNQIRFALNQSRMMNPFQRATALQQVNAALDLQMSRTPPVPQQPAVPGTSLVPQPSADPAPQPIPPTVPQPTPVDQGQPAPTPAPPPDQAPTPAPAQSPADTTAAQPPAAPAQPTPETPAAKSAAVEQLAALLDSTKAVEVMSRLKGNNDGCEKNCEGAWRRMRDGSPWKKYLPQVINMTKDKQGSYSQYVDIVRQQLDNPDDQNAELAVTQARMALGLPHTECQRLLEQTTRSLLPKITANCAAGTAKASFLIDHCTCSHANATDNTSRIAKMLLADKAFNERFELVEDVKVDSLASEDKALLRIAKFDVNWQQDTQAGEGTVTVMMSVSKPGKIGSKTLINEPVATKLKYHPYRMEWMTDASDAKLKQFKGPWGF